jgi:hypothetical protein
MTGWLMAAAAAMTLSSLAKATEWDPVEWRVADGGNGHWYMQFDCGGCSYGDARTWAEEHGAHLVTILDASEQQVVCQVMTSLTAWIGAERVGGEWTWSTGEPWTFGEICAPTAGADRIQLYGCRCWNDTFESDNLTLAAIIEWSADCNGDGIVDFGQILSGALLDIDANGIPDVCEPPLCPGDLITDGVVDGVDLAALLGAWGSSGGPWNADVTMDGIVDAADLAVLLGSWGECG